MEGTLKVVSNITNCNKMNRRRVYSKQLNKKRFQNWFTNLFDRNALVRFYYFIFSALKCFYGLDKNGREKNLHQLFFFN